MGFYINPAVGTKEQWLTLEGTLVHNVEHLMEAKFGTWKDPTGKPMLPVCLVDNGVFTAAAVCYSKDELEAFGHPDRRPRRWYLVPTSKLKEVGALSENFEL